MAPSLLSASTPSSPISPALATRQKWLLAIAGAAAISAEVVAWTTGQETSWLVAALTAVSILSSGLPTLKKGWIAIRNLTLNIYFLMSLAVIGALIIGKWPAAAMEIGRASCRERVCQ